MKTILKASDALSFFPRKEGDKIVICLCKIICNGILYPCWKDEDAPEIHLSFEFQVDLFNKEKHLGYKEEELHHGDCFLIGNIAFKVVKTKTDIIMVPIPEVLTLELAENIALTHNFLDGVQEARALVFAITVKGAGESFVWQFLNGADTFQVPSIPFYGTGANMLPEVLEVDLADLGHNVVNKNHVYTLTENKTGVFIKKVYFGQFKLSVDKDLFR